jgi:hypothetical protein
MEYIDRVNTLIVCLLGASGASPWFVLGFRGVRGVLLLDAKQLTEVAPVILALASGGRFGRALVFSGWVFWRWGL